MRGLEPPRIAPCASETHAYTSSATCPWCALYGSNLGPFEYQSNALPTELSALLFVKKIVPEIHSYAQYAQKTLALLHTGSIIKIYFQGSVRSAFREERETRHSKII